MFKKFCLFTAMIGVLATGLLAWARVPEPTPDMSCGECVQLYIDAGYPELGCPCCIAEGNCVTCPDPC